MAQPSLTQQVIDRCREALFTGIVRVHARQAEGEIWFLSGMLERARFGVSKGDAAMSRLLAAAGARIEVIPCLPNPTGGFEKGHPIEGELGPRLPVDLLRFCETYALTCTVDLRSGDSRGEAVYRLGELVSVRCDAGTDRSVAEMLEWKAGRFRFILPTIELPTSVKGAVVDQVQPAPPVDEAMTAAESAWRTAANEALKRKVVEVEAKLKAEERRQAEEAEPKSSAEAAESRPGAQEAESRPGAQEAEPKPSAEVTELKPSAEVAEPKPSAEVAEPKPSAEVTEPKPSAEVAEPKPSAEVVESKPSAEVTEPKPSAEVAESKPSAQEAAAAEAAPRAEEMHPAAKAPALSIVVRVQRVTTEYVDIAVPVTDAMMNKEPEADGSYRIESKALFAEAERRAREPDVAWQLDGEPRLGLHPVQTPPTG